MIHSAIQLKQGILVRIDTSETGKLINRFSTLSFFFLFHDIILFRGGYERQWNRAKSDLNFSIYDPVWIPYIIKGPGNRSFLEQGPWKMRYPAVVELDFSLFDWAGLACTEACVSMSSSSGSSSPTYHSCIRALSDNTSCEWALLIYYQVKGLMVLS